MDKTKSTEIAIAAAALNRMLEFGRSKYPDCLSNYYPGARLGRMGIRATQSQGQSLFTAGGGAGLAATQSYLSEAAMDADAAHFP
jgi:hypothetical protein